MSLLGARVTGTQRSPGLKLSDCSKSDNIRAHQVAPWDWNLFSNDWQWPRVVLTQEALETQWPHSVFVEKRALGLFLSCMIMQMKWLTQSLGRACCLLFLWSRPDPNPFWNSLIGIPVLDQGMRLWRIYGWQTLVFWEHLLFRKCRRQLEPSLVNKLRNLNF